MNPFPVKGPNHIQTRTFPLLFRHSLLFMLNRGSDQVPVGLPVFKIGRRVALRAVVGSTPIDSRYPILIPI